MKKNQANTDALAGWYQLKNNNGHVLKKSPPQLLMQYFSSFITFNYPPKRENKDISNILNTFTSFLH